jgi:hypothetical protein
VEARTGLGKQLMTRIGAGVYAGTMGTATRDCLMDNASHTLPGRATVSPRPGPGNYVMNDSAVFGRNSTFDGAFRWNPAKADLDEKVTRLQTINCDIKRINEKLRNIDKLPPEQAAALQSLSSRELKKLSANKTMVLQQVAESKAKIQKQVNHPGPAGKAKKILFDKNMPKSVPMNNKSERFFDPVVSTSSVYANPGPGLYDVAHFGTSFGNATLGISGRSQGFSWGKDYRPTDIEAPHSKSVATLKLDPKGYAYFSDLNATSGNNYHPNMITQSSRDAKRWEKGRRNPCKGQALLPKPGAVGKMRVKANLSKSAQQA